MIKGLILKDLYNLRQYAKTYLGMMIFMFIFAFFMKSPQYIVMMSMIMGVSTGFSIFALDEAGGYAYTLCLPVKRSQIVRSRYILVFMGMIGFLLFSLAGGAVVAAVTRYTDTVGWAGTALAINGVYLLMMSLVIPVTYRWKTEVARIVMIMFIFIPVALIAFADFFWKGFGDSLNTESVAIKVILGMMLAAVICYIVSYFVSLRIFTKKEI